MANGILRKNIDSASALIVQGSSDVLINGNGAVRIGDMELNGHRLVQGSSTVFVNGIAVSRMGDLDDNNTAGTPGSTTVLSG